MPSSKVLNKQSGFTIIEVLVSVFVFAMIAYGLISLVSYLITVNRQQGGALSDIDQSRKLIFQLIDEFRDAQTGSNGAYALDTAGNQQVVFYSNADVDTNIERIRYYIQNGKLYKGITEYNGTTYNTSTEATMIVQNNIANSSSTPLFYYYDGSYIGSSTQASLVQPVSVTAVKLVKINLQVYEKAGVKNTSFYTLSGSATIRNLKTNLGN